MAWSSMASPADRAECSPPEQGGCPQEVIKDEPKNYVQVDERVVKVAQEVIKHEPKIYVQLDEKVVKVTQNKLHEMTREVIK